MTGNAVHSQTRVYIKETAPMMPTCSEPDSLSTFVPRCQVQFPAWPAQSSSSRLRPSPSPPSHSGRRRRSTLLS